MGKPTGLSATFSCCSLLCRDRIVCPVSSWAALSCQTPGPVQIICSQGKQVLPDATFSAAGMALLQKILWFSKNKIFSEQEQNVLIKVFIPVVNDNVLNKNVV